MYKLFWMPGRTHEENSINTLALLYFISIRYHINEEINWDSLAHIYFDLTKFITGVCNKIKYTSASYQKYLVQLQMRQSIQECD